MNLTLIRHGQAGTRLAYDALSATGKLQSQLLGKHLQLAGARFGRWTSGALQRQRETARLAASEATSDLPPCEADAAWNEFDLDRVYEGIAPRLAEHNVTFRTHWEAIRKLTELHGGDESAAVNRRWSPADEMVIRAWVGGEVEFDGESWQEFRTRIRGALQSTADGAANVAASSAVVFTSATPIAISAGAALGLDDEGIFYLAGALLNSSMTELRWRNGRWRMFSFNNVPHLIDAALRTHR